MEWFLGALAVGVLILLVILLWWLLTKGAGPTSSALPTSGNFVGTGYSVWSYERGKWNLLEDRSASGFVPGPPPTEPGLHEGYCIRVVSVRPSGGPPT